MPFKIRTKLITAFIGLISVILGIAGGMAYYNQRALHKAIQCSEDADERMRLAGIFQIALQRALMPGNDYIITGDRKYISEFETASYGMENGIKMLEESMALLRSHMAAGEIKEEEDIFRDVKLDWQNIKDISLKIFALPDPARDKTAARLMEEMDYKWAYPAVKRLDRLNEISGKAYKEGIEAAYRTWHRSWFIMGAGALLLFALGVSFALLYSRLFVVPIKKLHKGANAIAGGDFKTRLDIRTGDEIQQLAGAMNEMAEKLDNFYGGLEEQVRERTRNLRFERDKLVRIFEAMEDGVYLVDQDYNIQYLNHVLMKEFGPIEGKKCYTYFHDRMEVCPWCPNQKVFAGETVRWEWTSFKNGKTYDLLDTPIKNSDGSLSKLEIFRDITERKKAEEELRLHAEIERNMAEAVYLIRVSDGVIVYTNPFFDRLFGYEPGELVGKHVSIVNAPGDKSSEAVANEIMNCLMQTGVWNGEVHNIRKDGTTFWCHANVLTFEHSQYGRVWLSLHQDITERKKAEEKIKEQLDFLQRFEKVAVKREFRIKELRDENEELKAKIEEMRKK